MFVGRAPYSVGCISNTKVNTLTLIHLHTMVYQSTIRLLSDDACCIFLKSMKVFQNTYIPKT